MSRNKNKSYRPVGYMEQPSEQLPSTSSSLPYQRNAALAGIFGGLIATFFNVVNVVFCILYACGVFS